MSTRLRFFALAIQLTTLPAFATAPKPDAPPATIKLVGDWQVEVTVPASQPTAAPVTARLDIAPPDVATVVDEPKVLPLFDPKAAGWRRGAPLRGVITQETTSRFLLDPTSLVVADSAKSGSTQYAIDRDYAADLEWGTVGRLPGGRIGEKQQVSLSYRYAPLRLDSIVLEAEGAMHVVKGTPHVATPRPPELTAGQSRVANVFVAGRLTKLGPEHLFPILETSYPEPPQASPSVAEQRLPKTLRKLRSGEPLRVLAWGDSVTVGSYVPDADKNRWQAQFVARLGERFPQAKIELSSEAWGGKNTGSYLAEPPGSLHNYQEKVLDGRPDLIVSEFVNDAGLKPAQVLERYGKLLADFERIGAEWIILTPHYVRPDWMGLAAERDIDQDPRPYVAGLRTFAEQHPVALADASLRWGRLWRQGIPYASLLSNAINHPDERGMKLFADSLMSLFP
jgi:lysophospholipase L1-like esterase